MAFRLHKELPPHKNCCFFYLLQKELSAAKTELTGVLLVNSLKSQLKGHCVDVRGLECARERLRRKQRRAEASVNPSVN